MDNKKHSSKFEKKANQPKKSNHTAKTSSKTKAKPANSKK